MQTFCKLRPLVRRLAILPLAVLAWLGAGGGSALAQPANNDFANAQDLGTAAAGSVLGNNIGATDETGEQLIFGVPGGQSVWYTWTAPADGSVTFTTAGSDFDSLLGVYTGPTVDNQTLVGEGYDLISFGASLPVTFVAAAGTTYNISVDGYNFGIPQGDITLTWTTNTSGAMSAGDFRFTSGTYMVAEQESIPVISANMGFIGPRLTVTRLAGHDGRVLVNYSVTNGFYTNGIQIVTSGTNITTVVSQGGVPISTNINFVTNIVAAWRYQDNQFGQYVSLLPVYYWTNIVGNFNGTNLTAFISIQVTNADPGLPCVNLNLGGSSFLDPTNNTLTTVTTNTFCYFSLTNQLVNSATPFSDYIPVAGTLIFDDYQMSADILVDVFPNFSTFNTNVIIPNRVLVATITGVALDPLETTAISAPTTNSTFTTALLNILDQDIAVNYGNVPQANNTGPTVSPFFPPGTGISGVNILNFASATLRCTEDVNGTHNAVVWVLRSSIDYSQGCSVLYRTDFLYPDANRNDAFRRVPIWEMPLQAGSDYAAPNNSFTYAANVDFTSVSGTLTWGAFDGNPKPIVIPINDDNLVEFNEDILVQLYEPVNTTGMSVGYVRTCNLTVMFDEQPAGALDRSFNPDNNANTSPPYNLHPGPNNTVYTLAIQPDGKTVIGGDFTAYNTTPRNRVARINVNGSLDTGFDPADGADAFVSSILVDSDGKVVIGGAFGSINRVSRNRIARLNSDGSLDTTFTPGLGGNGTIWAMGFNTNGTIYVAGEFSTMNSTNRNRIARLNTDGSLDTTFDPGIGPDGTISSLNVQPDGKVIIAGEFGTVDNALRGHIARLNSDGSLDATFNPNDGFNDAVFSTALQPDGKVIVGGGFNAFQQYARNGITRLNSDGSLDLNFNAGDGPDDDVYAVALQSDGTILVGGIFKHFNQSRRVGITRLLSSGVVDTSFMDTSYNQFAGIPTHYFDETTEPPNYIYQIAVQPSGGVLIVGNFPRVGGGSARDDIHNRHNFARLVGGSTPGPGNIELAFDTYTADQSGQSIFITMNRVNGSLGQAAVSVRPDPLPSGPGAAVNGQDFTFDLTTYGTPTWITSWADGGGGGTWQIMDGTFGQNNGFGPTVDPGQTINYPQNDVFLGIIDNTNLVGNRSLNLKLSNPNGNDINLLGGENIACGVALGRSAASLTIVDPHTLPGVLGFSSPTYTVSESSNAVITVTRTNGTTGLATVQYTTANGTATNLIHYRPASGRLTFNAGDTFKTFTVTNIDESIKEGDHTILVRLFSPSVASLGLSNAVITVIDNDIVGGYVEFTSATFATNENAGTAYVTVNRNGGGAGTLTVQIAATNGTAVNGLNYTAFTNQLTWANNDVLAKTVAIPIFDDGVVNAANLTVNLRLFSATLNSTNSPFGLGNTNSAVLTLINSDFRGQLGFSTPAYSVNENGGPGYVTIVRSGGSAETITATFNANTGTATPGTDYVPTNKTLVFGPGKVSETVLVPIIDNSSQDIPRAVFLTLNGVTPAGSLGSVSNAVLNIVDDETYNQPPGGPDTAFDPNAGFDDAVHTLALQTDAKFLVGGDFNTANGVARHRMARLNADGSLDATFSSTATTAGANASVLIMLPQTDRRILMGGMFTTINGVNRNFLARINPSGTIDSTFNPGSGPDNTVFAIGETFDGANRKILIGGAFTTFNSATHTYLARLNDNGSFDTSFNPGLGPNGAVFALALQPDGKVVIGGDFSQVNSTPRNRIARLNADGSLDFSFNPGTGPNGSVRAVAVQLDGRILVGGLFTNFNGLVLSRIARLNANGPVDTSFTPGLGANDAVSCITIQPDTRILVGGQFTRFNGATRNRLTRLNNDGTLDTMINFGTGCDNYVDSTVVQTNGMIVLGGGFTHYDGQPHQHIARIYGGTIGGAGNFEFTSAYYPVTENSSNVLVTVRRRNGTSGDPGNVGVTVATSDGTARVNTNYLAVSTNLVFPPGEVFGAVTVPIIDDFVITPDLTVNLAMSNPTPADASGPALGNQPIATIIISNMDSGISFSTSAYIRNEDAVDGVATLPLVRVGSTIGPASVTFATTFGGTAIPGINYTPVSNLVVFAAGQSSNFVQIPVIHDPTAQGDKTVIAQLSDPSGALLFNPSTATLTIVDVEHAPGQFVFSQATNTVSEGGGFLPITVQRINGRSGAVSVNFNTIPGTAAAGAKFVATNGFLSFADGETSKSFNVQILEDNQVTGDEFFSIALSGPTGGAALGNPSSETVIILEDDIGVNFSSSLYVVSESVSNLTLTILRPFGTNTITHVSYATTNGAGINGAVSGSNYVAASGSLTFNPGETFKTLTLSILHNTNVTGNLVFGINLFTNQFSTNVSVIFPSFASVLILDAEAGISFTAINAGVFENATNIALPVICSNPNVEPISVSYATADGISDNPGFAGVDYVPVSGTLSFTNGITTNYIVVTVIDNLKVDGDRDFSVSLTGPTSPGVLQVPATETIIISNNDAGISFSSAGYDVFKNGVSQSIGVVRTGYTNSTVSVSYLTRDGTASNGVDYVATGGTLTFTNGQTATNFSVTVIDSTVVKPNLSLGLVLTNVVGNASLQPPSTASLTIHDNSGSLIVPAGSLLTGENMGQNSVIEPGETVTLLFALRNAGGTNTGDLVATLTNLSGITLPSAPQHYGSLVVDGPSVSRSFSFTASGTNGQVITATFNLQDGGVNRGTAMFSYVMGTASTSLATNGLITINDNTNATPYPSTLNVQGLNGTLSKVTITLSNMTHFFPADIDALLLSPTGQKMLVMANSGSAPIQNVTLTFDDDAASALPQSGQISSGTYRPNGVSLVTTFPSPAPPAPYATNLSVFVNNSPNGLWSLFVIDDSPSFAGTISNGWSLKLSTLNPVAPAADLVLGVALTNKTTVSNLVYRVNLGYNITVNNAGPATASNVSVTDVFPTNGILVSASPAGYTVVSNVLTFTNLGSLAKDAFTTLNVTISVPAVASIVSNTVSVIAASPADPNLANNTVTTNSTIANPTSDVSVSLAGAPNPMLLGDILQYSLMVSNNANFSPAANVKLTNTLSLNPPVQFLSNSAAASLSGNRVIFNFALIPTGGTTNVSIWVRPLVAGSVTNNASVGSILIDPFKVNNSASVKTLVEQFTATASGQNILLSWPTDVGAYTLLTATNLASPNWTVVTNQTQNLLPGFNTVTLGTTNKLRFFKLQKQ